VLALLLEPAVGLEFLDDPRSLTTRVTVSREVPIMSAICWWVREGVRRRLPSP
jgi:hypothetical protein